MFPPIDQTAALTVTVRVAMYQTAALTVTVTVAMYKTAALTVTVRVAMYQTAALTVTNHNHTLFYCKNTSTFLHCPRRYQSPITGPILPLHHSNKVLLKDLPYSASPYPTLPFSQ